MNRIKMKRGTQKTLIQNSVKKIGSLKKLGISLNIPYSTIKKYSQERLLLPKNVFDKILDIAGKKNFKINFQILNRNWGRILGGKKGMEILKKRYPKQIIEWRKKGAKSSSLKPKYNTKKIKIPELNEKLSEFIGIYLGDGTMTPYFIRIIGDNRYDQPYYNYLTKLIENLFGLDSKIKREKKVNTSYLVVRSKKLCLFLKDRFGLNYGHKIKNKTIIPKEILQNKKLSLACLRGLIDTDGSVSRRGRGGSQFCIQFTSHNKELLDQVSKLGKDLNLFTFSDKTGTGTNNQKNILEYFKKVGSSNLRHIVRFYERFYNNNTIYQKEVIDYYQKSLYKTMNFPFKIDKDGPVS